jgi:N6-L-threonylcarbamoyladenine synthase
MRILAIETSCDETALAVIDAPEDTNAEPKVLINFVRSQIEKHAPFGGVVPNLAKREHERVLPLLWKEVQEHGLHKNIDMVAVTQGPGLAPCLWRGVEFAKEVAQQTGAPLYGINHLKGHVYTVFPNRDIAYPLLSLIVSGGHTELVFSERPGSFRIIGRTVDDAAGEAFDKVARLLGLGFPGGPEISRVARDGNPEKYDLPRPMIDSKDFNFSFAGLKTAVMYLVKGIHPSGRALDVSDSQVVADVAASFQQAAVDTLVEKMIRAAQEYHPKTLIAGGGVAANTLLRDELKKNVHTHAHTLHLILPDPKLTGDNALMIALAAWQEHKTLSPTPDLEAHANLSIEER